MAYLDSVDAEIAKSVSGASEEAQNRAIIDIMGGPRRLLRSVYTNPSATAEEKAKASEVFLGTLAELESIITGKAVAPTQTDDTMTDDGDEIIRSTPAQCLTNYNKCLQNPPPPPPSCDARYQACINI